MVCRNNNSSAPLMTKMLNESLMPPDEHYITIVHFLDNCHKVDGVSQHYLTVYKCNAIALLTVEEALQQVYEEPESSKKENALKVLEDVQHYLVNSAMFSSTISANSNVNAKLELYKLQYQGRGIEYLNLRKQSAADII